MICQLSGYPIFSYEKNHRHKIITYDGKIVSRNILQKSTIFVLLRSRFFDLRNLFFRILFLLFFFFFFLDNAHRHSAHLIYIWNRVICSSRSLKCGCPSSCFMDLRLPGFVPSRTYNWRFLRVCWKVWRPKQFFTTSPITVLRASPTRNRMSVRTNFR